MKKILLTLLLTSSIYSQDINDLYLKAKKSIVEYNGQSEKLIEAKKYLDEINLIDPNSKESKIIRGKLIFQKAYISYDNYHSDYLDVSKRLALDVLSSYPQNIDALLLLASTYRNNGTAEGFKKSKLILKKAHNIDPDHIKVLLSLLSTYSKEKRNDQALIIGNKIIKNSTVFWQESAALSELTTIYKRLKQYDKANDAYLRIIKLEPDSPWALVNYSSFLTRKTSFQDYDKAILYAKKSLELSDFGMGYNKLSRAYYGKGYMMFWGNKSNLDKDGSKKWFELGIKANPDNYNNYYGLGSWYYYVGHKNKNVEFIKKALLNFQKSLYLKPSYDLAKSRIKKTKALLKRVN